MTAKNTDSLVDTVAPKSDQLNADDLLTGPITVKVQAVRRSTSPDQPIDVLIEGHRPYRPCKSMRRILIAVWGDNGADWVGKSMTLFCDKTVKFGGVAVGGIRISHISGIDKPIELMLTTTRAKRSMYKVHPLGATIDSADDLITDDQAATLQSLIEEVGADLAGFLRYMRAGTINDIPAAHYARAVSALEQKRKQK